jgi:hypothetical protein
MAVVGHRHVTSPHSAVRGIKTCRISHLDGSNLENVLIPGGMQRPGGLALDVAGGKMYWTDSMNRPGFFGDSGKPGAVQSAEIVGPEPWITRQRAP